MSFKSAQRSRVLLGDFSLSPKTSKIELPHPTDLLDITTLEDTSRRFLPGMSTSTTSITGYLDIETAQDSAAWTEAQPLTYGFQGLAFGDPVLMVNTFRTNFQVGAPANGVVGFDLAAQTDGLTSFGFSLHDLSAETSSTVGTGYDQTVVSTTAGGVGHLHVTAFSGFSQIIVKIDDSADNVSFATIGTFATVTGATTERLTIAGTVRQYVRASWTKTGTGSCTFSVAFARL